MSVINGKYRNLIIEVLVIVIVLAIPPLLSRWMGANKIRNPFYVRMAIYSFADLLALAVFFYLIPPRSLWKKLREFGVVPGRFTDILIGLGYCLIVMVLEYLLYVLIVRPLGFVQSSYAYHLSNRCFAHSQFDFIVLTIETFVWVLFQEVILRGYLYGRIRQALTSTAVLAFCMLSIDIVYQLLFFSNYKWELAVISGVSIIAYIRGKRLVRPIVSNFAFTMLVYATSMGYFGLGH
jgi:hypothetical protein